MRFLSRRPREIEETEMTPRPETVALAAGLDVARRRALRFGALRSGKMSASQMAAAWSLWRRDDPGGSHGAGPALSGPADAGDDPMLWRRTREPETDRADRAVGGAPGAATESAATWFLRLWSGRRA